jgi:hypothetical protein
MLALLLDENISDEVARQVAARRPDIPIFSAHDWEEGRFKGMQDEAILRAASAAGLTLVTYDVNTIPLLLTRLANEGFTHGGIVFVSSLAIRSDDYGRLTRALIQLYDTEQSAEWSDRLFFLSKPEEM